MNDCLMHPDLIGENGDPEGSTRYYVTILHIYFPSDTEKVTYSDLININSMFIIKEYTNCVAPHMEVFDGVLIKEKDGKYIFGVVKVGDKGQVVIPKDARKLYDIKAGDALLVLGDAKGMALLKTEVFQSAIDQAMEGLSK